MPLRSRVTLVLLSLAVAVGASWAINALEPALRPDVRARNAAPDQAVALYTDAIRREPANPYHWADLGDAWTNLDRIPQARQAFRQALELSRDIPQIWLRDANFHFGLGEPGAALVSAARVLEKVPDYDGVLFSYFDRFELPPARILQSIGSDRRASRAYLQYLVDHDQTGPATAAWNLVGARGHLDDRLAASYIDALLRNRLYDRAALDWPRYLGARRTGYPDRNLLWNAGFEQDPTGCALDWRIPPHDLVETTRDTSSPHSGKSALRIHFSGTDNVSYDNVGQVTLLHSGRYRLTFWIRTEDITTNEGVRIEAYDLRSGRRLSPDAEPVTGTHPWMPLTLEMTIVEPVTPLVLKIVRRPSTKFDNKIAGTAWLDDFVLVPTA